MESDVGQIKHKAVFLDRDGVLIRDTGLICSVAEVEFLPGVLQALVALKEMGFLLLVVTNQTVVSRGMATVEDVCVIHDFINEELGGLIDSFYFCPHHPQATLEEYRMECSCRKPRSGMLEQGAADFGLDLRECWMVGDRISDIIAGINAGCRTVQLCTGAHTAPPIESSALPDVLPKPDYTADSLLSASVTIGENSLQ